MGGGTGRPQYAELLNLLYQAKGAAALARSRRTFAVANVYINALTGSDTNDGLTPATAWATNGALDRAVGTYGYINPPGTVPRWFTINYLGAIPTDLLNLQAVLAPNACLRVLGTALKTTLRVGTITAAVAYASGPNVLGSITDPTVADWTPYINQRLTWTGGAAVGAVCFIANNLGGGQARIGNSGILQDIVLTNITFPLLVAPSTGTYKIESLPSLFLGLFDIQATNNGNFIEPAVNFVDLSLERAGTTGADPQPTGNGSVEFAFQGCVYNGNEINGITFSACITAFPNGMQLRAGVWGVFSACVFNKTCIFIAGSTGTMFGYTLAEGCGFSSLQGSFMELENAAAENAVPVSFCNQFGDGATATCNAFSPGTISVRGNLLGSGNAGVGLRVPRAHTIDCSALPAITGAGGDFALGSYTTAAAGNNATAAFENAATACSWTNMAATMAAGGFGGCAVDLHAGTRLVTPDVGAP